MLIDVMLIKKHVAVLRNHFICRDCYIFEEDEVIRFRREDYALTTKTYECTRPKKLKKY